MEKKHGITVYVNTGYNLDRDKAAVAACDDVIIDLDSIQETYMDDIKGFREGDKFDTVYRQIDSIVKNAIIPTDLKPFADYLKYVCKVANAENINLHIYEISNVAISTESQINYAELLVAASKLFKHSYIHECPAVAEYLCDLAGSNITFVQPCTSNSGEVVETSTFCDFMKVRAPIKVYMDKNGNKKITVKDQIKPMNTNQVPNLGVNNWACGTYDYEQLDSYKKIDIKKLLVYLKQKEQ